MSNKLENKWYKDDWDEGVLFSDKYIYNITKHTYLVHIILQNMKFCCNTHK